MKRFEQRKNSMLKKSDKSSKGNWDSRIIKLCDCINKKENYYSTSSCSGRVILMKDVNKKERNLFLRVSHNLIKGNFFENIKLDKKNDLKFKFEPFIIHVACEDLEGAEKLIQVGLKVGFKQVGIISLGKNIIVEIKGSEKIEFPFSKKGEVLVKEEFLREVVKKSNLYFKKSWDRIDKLDKGF
jgi:tRNA wybutosine-synthesizing protein 3